MKILVTGCRNPLVEQELISGTRFFASELLSSKMMKHITIEIVMKSSIGDLGNCSISYYNDWYKPREFIIELRSRRSLKNTLITLAHEMVHVKQFAKGELDPALSRWKSNKYCDKIEYWDQPWEKEARRLQHKLLLKFEQGF